MRSRALRQRPVVFACLALACTVVLSFQLGRFFPIDRPTSVVEVSYLPQAPRPAGPTSTASQQRPRITAFVGVQTGFTTNKPLRKYDYSRRRRQLRNTWFPKDRAALQRLLDDHGLVARFVVGHSTVAKEEAQMQAESLKHGDFLQLNIFESYAELGKKTITYFSTVIKIFDPQYIIKVDDDVFLRLDRLPAVVHQWKSLGAQYIGCMKTGAIQTNPKMRWYEPQHALLGGRTYFAHTWGSCYVLSGDIATILSTIPLSALRFLRNEDVTVGSWLLALNSTHFDDRRMCEPRCTVTSVAVYDFPKCAGLCNSVDSLPQLWNDPQCRTKELEPPLRPQSWKFP